MNQIQDMWDFAEYLVWLSEVETGFVSHEEAEETMDGYWRMCYCGPERGYDHRTAERAVATSPGLYQMFLDWRRRCAAAGPSDTTF